MERDLNGTAVLDFERMHEGLLHLRRLRVARLDFAVGRVEEWLLEKGAGEAQQGRKGGLMEPKVKFLLLCQRGPIAWKFCMLHCDFRGWQVSGLQVQMHQDLFGLEVLKVSLQVVSFWTQRRIKSVRIELFSHVDPGKSES